MTLYPNSARLRGLVRWLIMAEVDTGLSTRVITPTTINDTISVIAFILMSFTKPWTRKKPNPTTAMVIVISTLITMLSFRRILPSRRMCQASYEEGAVFIYL